MAKTNFHVDDSFTFSKEPYFSYSLVKIVGVPNSKRFHVQLLIFLFLFQISSTLINEDSTLPRSLNYRPNFLYFNNIFRETFK